MRLRIPPWVFERNPYFWAVDEEGKQLPYIDRVLHTQVDLEVRNLQAVAGEVDYTWGLPFNLMPDLLDAQDAGRLRVIQYEFPSDIDHQFYFNLTTADEAQREIYNDIRFRQACSYAINREEINQINYFGTTQPAQALPPVGSPAYDACVAEGLDQLYTEFNPDEANRLLDEMGLDQRNADGWRLRPDGEELFINLLTYNWPEDVEIEVDQLQAVGLHVTFDMMDNRLFGERSRSGEWDAIAIAGSPMHPFLLTEASCRSFVPIRADNAWSEYGLYHATNGAQGTPHEGLAKEVYDTWLEIFGETDPERQIQLVVDVMRIAKEQVWTIGSVTRAPNIGIVNPTLRNLPSRVFMGYDNIMADVYRPETLFYGA